MNTQRINALKEIFEQHAQTANEVEFWYARDLQKLLGYTDWRNFLKTIEKAIVSCQNAGEDIENHFVESNKMVKIGSGTERAIADIMLTRYACYLVAQNGDTQKEEIAFAQSYFALQTRKQELIEERILLNERLKARKKLTFNEIELSQIIYERGVDQAGFGRIRSKGDAVLFGGNTTAQMKNKLNIPTNRALADFLPTITITAKNLATEITNFNVKQNDLYGEAQITNEHTKNNQDVRDLLGKSSIQPENLPVEEDLKRLERRLKTNDKKALKGLKGLK